MNERIKELLEQATSSRTLSSGVEYDVRVDQEKFAELLIKECANQCTHDGPFTAEVVWGKQFREKILKHFGVE